MFGLPSVNEIRSYVEEQSGNKLNYTNTKAEFGKVSGLSLAKIIERVREPPDFVSEAMDDNLSLFHTES